MQALSALYFHQALSTSTIHSPNHSHAQTLISQKTSVITSPRYEAKAHLRIKYEPCHHVKWISMSAACIASTCVSDCWSETYILSMGSTNY